MLMRRHATKTRILYLLALSLAVPAGWAAAQATPKAALLALSKQDRTLAIVDPADLRVVATVPVGDDPHEVLPRRTERRPTSPTTGLVRFTR